VWYWTATRIRQKRAVPTRIRRSDRGFGSRGFGCGRPCPAWERMGIRAGADALTCGNAVGGGDRTQLLSGWARCGAFLPYSGRTPQGRARRRRFGRLPHRPRRRHRRPPRPFLTSSRRPSPCTATRYAERTRCSCSHRAGRSRTSPATYDPTPKNLCGAAPGRPAYPRNPWLRSPRGWPSSPCLRVRGCGNGRRSGPDGR
jgi:hypothetical protein